MSVYGVSYSVAQDNILNIYNKFEKVVTLNGLTDRLFEIEDDIPMDKDDGLGYFEPEGTTEPVSIVEHIRTKTNVQKFIDDYNSRYSNSTIHVSLSDFSICPYVCKITLHDEECIALKISTSKNSSLYSTVYKGDWYFELTGKGFPNWNLFTGIKYYPIIHEECQGWTIVNYYRDSFSTVSKGTTVKNFTVTTRTLENYFNS